MELIVAYQNDPAGHNMDKFISTCLADTQLGNEHKTKIKEVKDELESFRNSIKNELPGVVEL